VLKLSAADLLLVISDSRLTRADERVLAAIAKCRSVRPSRDRIKKLSGIDIPNISRSVRRLVELEYLSVRSEEGHTNTYTKGAAFYTATRIKDDIPYPYQSCMRVGGINGDTQALKALGANSDLQEGGFSGEVLNER